MIRLEMLWAIYAARNLRGVVGKKRDRLRRAFFVGAARMLGPYLTDQRYREWTKDGKRLLRDYPELE